MEALQAISSLQGNKFFLYGESLDFLNGQALLTVTDGKVQINLMLSVETKQLKSILCTLERIISSTESVIFGWNIKDIFSYIKYRIGSVEWKGALLDLRVMESFLGLSKERPAGLLEAQQRFAVICKHPGWVALNKVYKRIHLPLVREVLPTIESRGLADRGIRNRVHPYYVPEGQIYGRMKCLDFYTNRFNPHTLEESRKDQLHPLSCDEVLLDFDFSHMEVSILQWLSGDKTLGEIIDSGQDVYCSIWERLTHLECTPSQRSICKIIFLPVVFGLGSKTLSEKHNISENTAKKLIENLYKEFHTAMVWIENFQQSLVNNIATDYFGRQRTFLENQYKSRSFAIQAPAAIICLDKLIKLHQNDLKIAYHVHDGYSVISHKCNVSETKGKTMEVLQSTDDWYSGLKLKVKNG